MDTRVSVKSLVYQSHARISDNHDHPISGPMTYWNGAKHGLQNLAMHSAGMFLLAKTCSDPGRSTTKTKSVFLCCFGSAFVFFLQACCLRLWRHLRSHSQGISKWKDDKRRDTWCLWNRILDRTSFSPRVSLVSWLSQSISWSPTFVSIGCQVH